MDKEFYVELIHGIIYIIVIKGDKQFIRWRICE
jgi:hypothetical protein